MFISIVPHCRCATFPLGMGKIKDVCCYSSQLSLRDVPLQGVERFEVSLCVCKKRRGRLRWVCVYVRKERLEIYTRCLTIILNLEILLSQQKV